MYVCMYVCFCFCFCFRHWILLVVFRLPLINRMLVKGGVYDLRDLIPSRPRWGTLSLSNKNGLVNPTRLLHRGRQGGTYGDMHAVLTPRSVSGMGDAKDAQKTEHENPTWLYGGAENDRHTPPHAVLSWPGVCGSLRSCEEQRSPSVR